LSKVGDTKLAQELVKLTDANPASTSKIVTEIKDKAVVVVKPEMTKPKLRQEHARETGIMIKLYFIFIIFFYYSILLFYFLLFYFYYFICSKWIGS